MPNNMVNGFNINGTEVPYNYDSLGNKLEKTSIAREYSNIDTYSVNEYVLYNGKMYRCKQEILVGETFDPTKWDECSTGTELNYIKKYYSINDGIKHAFLNLLSHVAYTDEHGQDYLDELEAELFRTADIVSISAVFNQGQNIIYDTDSLDTLKQYLVVTATYDDSSTGTVTGYSLSGMLTAGTSTITVSYGGKTTTFDVIVSERYEYSLSSGLLIKLTGTISGSPSSRMFLAPTNMNRRAFLCKSGEHLLDQSSDNTTFTPSEYYPIPVPSNATKVTVAITPNTQYFSISEGKWNAEASKYDKDLDSGWKLGSYTLTLAGTTTFIAIASKYNSSGSSYPTEPTELAVQFSDE